MVVLPLVSLPSKLQKRRTLKKKTGPLHTSLLGLVFVRGRASILEVGHSHKPTTSDPGTAPRIAPLDPLSDGLRAPGRGTSGRV